MAKVQIKSETIATFGGMFHVMDVFERLGLGRLIDSSLGKRDASWNAFRYSEVIETLFCNYLCGGDCLEDINMLAPQLSLRPGTRIPNSDTVGRVLKSLASENISYACEKSGSSYSFNIAERLNTLLLNMVKTLGLLKAGEEVTLDFDHQFIPAHKFDAKYSYKKDYGYFPGWASIGGILVGGENRDGNTNVKFHQADTLIRIMDRTKQVLGITSRISVLTAVPSRRRSSKPLSHDANISTSEPATALQGTKNSGCMRAGKARRTLTFRTTTSDGRTFRSPS